MLLSSIMPLKTYLHSLYQDVDPCIFTRDTISETYGEILFEGIEKILKKIQFNESDVIYDLGSGLGKVIVQIALQHSVKKLCGIELNARINEYAQRAKKMIGKPDVHFICGSFLEVPFNDATIIFILSPCFTQSMLWSLGDIINHLPNIKTVMTLRAIPNLAIPFKQSFRVEGTWDSALCYLYQRHHFL